MRKLFNKKECNEDDLTIATLLLVFGFPILGLLNAVGNLTCLILLGIIGFFLVKSFI